MIIGVCRVCRPWMVGSCPPAARTADKSSPSLVRRCFYSVLRHPADRSCGARLRAVLQRFLFRLPADTYNTRIPFYLRRSNRHRRLARTRRSAFTPIVYRYHIAVRRWPTSKLSVSFRNSTPSPPTKSFEKRLNMWPRAPVPRPPVLTVRPRYRPPSSTTAVVFYPQVYRVVACTEVMSPIRRLKIVFHDEKRTNAGLLVTFECLTFPKENPFVPLL